MSKIYPVINIKMRYFHFLIVVIQNAARLSEDQSHFKGSVMYAARTTMLDNVDQDIQCLGPKKCHPWEMPAITNSF